MYEVVDLAVDGGDLALKSGLQVLECRTRSPNLDTRLDLVSRPLTRSPNLDTRLDLVSRPFLRRVPEAVEPSNHAHAHVLPRLHYETLLLAETVQTRP